MVRYNNVSTPSTQHSNVSKFSTKIDTSKDPPDFRVGDTVQVLVIAKSRLAEEEYEICTVVQSDKIGEEGKHLVRRPGSAPDWLVCVEFDNSRGAMWFNTARVLVLSR
jgi:hypothetical protein